MWIEMLENRRMLSASLLNGDVAALLDSSPASYAQNRTYSAHMTGAAEVPARITPAQGQFLYRINKAGTEITYRLIVANIDNVVGAHIHIGAPTATGPVVVPLMAPQAPGGGPSNGVLATGTITAANLTGPLAGQSLSTLITAIESGNAYVNVHTNDGVAPTNTGPGDFPGGELRVNL